MNKYLKRSFSLILPIFLLVSCAFPLLKANAEVLVEGKEGEVTVVTSGGGLPHSYIDEKGEWTGLDADVWKEIGTRNNWTINYQQAAFDAIFGEVAAGKADVASNGFGITEQRLENFDASIPYYASVQAFGVNEVNGEINSINDLKGKKVGIETGSASEDKVRELSEKIGFEVITYKKSPEALNDLGLGRIDAFANDDTYIRHYANETGTDIKILDEKIDSDNVGFFFRKDDKDSAELIEKVNKTIEEMLEDGTLAKLTEQWLEDDMTQYIKK